MRVPALIDLSRDLSTVAITMEAVLVEKLAKEYGTLVAVDDLSFTVSHGDVLGFLGPNGAGKTTAIRVLTTILRATRGTFCVAGMPHTRPLEIRQRVGVLPESTGYPERQTGEEFLRFHARLFGHTAASARVTAARLLADVRLADRSRMLIADYSRGMRQRLGLARALVNDPEVVFLDEPTLGLDPAGQRQILSLVRQMSGERGAAVLLSTHLLAEVEEVCTHALILNKGRVAAAGTVAQVAARAAEARSARLRVAPERLDDAIGTLRHAAGIQTVARGNGRPGTLTVTLTNSAMNPGLRALADANVPVLSFELEGARLSDAFLAMTEEGA
jgi:ABC-2 type transport system ATP-binding protein